MTPKLAARLEALGVPGTVRMVTILHDDDCPALKSQRVDDCTCDPDLQWTAPIRPPKEQP